MRSVNVAPAVGPTLGVGLSGTTLTGKVLTITFKGLPNSTYVIQGSSNLTSWTQAGSITTDANGNGQYSATVNGTGAQYFRALFQ